MEEHEVKTVKVTDKITFKNTDVEFDATYFYCDLAEEFYADEDQMRENYLNMKKAYGEKVGLLETEEI